MEVLMKILTSVLGVLAVLACLATIGAVGYSLGRGESAKNEESQVQEEVKAPEETPVPTATPENTDGENAREPEAINHVHNYVEALTEKLPAIRREGKNLPASAETSIMRIFLPPAMSRICGRLQGTQPPARRGRECGSVSTVMRLWRWRRSRRWRRARAMYISIPPALEREPSCILAGLRKYTCSVCGSFLYGADLSHGAYSNGLDGGGKADDHHAGTGTAYLHGLRGGS